MTIASYKYLYNKLKNKIKTIMINKKGYHYFQHINPSHNIQHRKLNNYIDNNYSQQGISQYNNYNIHIHPHTNGYRRLTHSNTNKTKKITGIFGKGYNNYNQVNYVQRQKYHIMHKSTQYRLTFQKLQHILSTQNSSLKTKLSTQHNPQNKQIYIKNSYVSQNSNKVLAFLKIPKNKQLKQYLFHSHSYYQDRDTRPRTTLSKNYSKYQQKSQLQMHHSNTTYNQNTNDGQYNRQKDRQSMISPSMHGVFIPSSKFKSSKLNKNTKSKSSKRYNTSYQS